MTLNIGAAGMLSSKETQVRVDLKPALPMDPLQIQTMADYDLQLCLYRTWFEYDASRKAKPGIISAWNFDPQAGTYRFTIAPDSRWSNGTPILPDQLLKNLKRAITLKTGFGEAIQALIHIEKAKVINNHSFELETRDHLPSEKFFQRMGSSFLAPVHPEDWDTDLKLIGNHLTSGPYKILAKSAEELRLESNPFDQVSLKTRALSVTIRFGAPTELTQFIEGRTWANVMQTATLMPNDQVKMVKDRKLPYWTRGFDRVSLLKPLGNGEKLELRRKIAQRFAAVWADYRLPTLPFNTAKAYSLQPRGYPLFNEIDYRPLLTKKSPKNKSMIKIVAQRSPQNDFQKPLIVTVFENLGIEIKWVDVSSYRDGVEATKKDAEIDFELSSFGVADPEPATWMGLVLSDDSSFVEVVQQDLDSFKKIAGIPSIEVEVKEFQTLLGNIGLRGSYVPLFHFSTLSLGQPGISFEKVSELDETVDYSKLLFK